ncbi:MAG: hypothetical protein I3274_05635 [Candidatus Moeniiplasma glomeromycotorum]|nr:hypothetical protein [Candidatus Moeniiplasma glomeromycotorum]
MSKSRFLKNLPWPVFIGRTEDSVMALFAFPSFLVKQSANAKRPTGKFVWLGEKRELLLIDPDFSNNSHSKSRIFGEIVKGNDQIKEKLEDILIEKFAQNLDNYHIIKEICEENNYHPSCLIPFKELKKSDPNTFFSNLYKYINFLVGRDKKLAENIRSGKLGQNIFCGNEKDILIIAEPETYKFIKQNDTNNFFQELVGDIICANLENGVKLIMIAKWGILVPCYAEPYSRNGFYYLNICYEVDLADITPAVIFRE